MSRMPTKTYVCNKCGMISPGNPEEVIYSCKRCKNEGDFTKCRVPYSAKAPLTGAPDDGDRTPTPDSVNLTPIIYEVSNTTMGEILPSTKETHPKKKRKPRCHHCHKKLGHMVLPPCKCGFTFCLQHQSKHSHNCSHDSKAENRADHRQT